MNCGSGSSSTADRARAAAGALISVALALAALDGCAKIPTKASAPPARPTVECLQFPATTGTWSLRATGTDPEGRRVRFGVLLNGVEFPGGRVWSRFTGSGVPLQLDILLPAPGRYRLEIVAQDAGENLSPPSEAIEASYSPDWIEIRRPAFPVPSDRITALAVKGSMRFIGTGDAGAATFDRYAGWHYLDTAMMPLADAHVTAIWPVTVGGELRAWVGTMNGGLRAWVAGQEVFYNTSNSSLPNNHVTAISMSTHGAWIGTLGGGVARIDTAAWTWRLNNTTNSPLPSDRITSIAHAANGAWVGTEDRGLAKWTPGGAGWTLYNTGNSALPSDRITCIAVDSSQNVWVGTDGGGLAVLRGTTWTTYRAGTSGLPSDRVLSLLAGPEKPTATIWVGTDAGLARFRQTSWRTYTTAGTLLPGNTITALGYAFLGWPLWVGTDRGLVNFRGDAGAAPSPPPGRPRPWQP